MVAIIGALLARGGVIFGYKYLRFMVYTLRKLREDVEERREGGKEGDGREDWKRHLYSVDLYGEDEAAREVCTRSRAAKRRNVEFNSTRTATNSRSIEI